MRLRNILMAFSTVFLLSSGFVYCEMTKDEKAYLEKSEKAAEEHYKRGMDNYKQNKLSSAKAEWEKAITLSTSHKNSVYALKQLERENYTGSNDEYCHETIKNFYEEGMKYYRKGEYEKAGVEFKNALMLNANQKKIKEFYDETNLKLKNDKDPGKEEEKTKISLPEPVKVIEYPKEDKKKKVQIKKVQAKKNDKQEKKAEPQDDLKTDELYKEGLKNYQKKNYEKAMFLWEEVLKIDPKHEKALKNILKLKKEIKDK